MADRGAVWTDDETRLLIKFWGQKEVQESLEGMYRNSEVYDQIADKMTENGYDRNAKQCRCKVKQLKKDYRREKELGIPSKRRAFRFFDEMEGIIGNVETPGLECNASESVSDCEISSHSEEAVKVDTNPVEVSAAVPCDQDKKETQTERVNTVTEEKVRKRRSITSLADRLRAAKRWRSSFNSTRENERDTKSLLERTLASQTPEFQASVLLEIERMKIEKEIELERMRLEYKQKQWKDILELLVKKNIPLNTSPSQSGSGNKLPPEDINSSKDVNISSGSEVNHHD
ncbi:zinc finger and SCAN domain-containing protein 29-like [Saccostrea cucullata]|uniref:zinc finger and SCAN domain-containing protein 29-like n=1 Tax=Saccostrea cuccullata TaxID=36930 RepID=UPI002ED69868